MATRKSFFWPMIYFKDALNEDSLLVSEKEIKGPVITPNTNEVILKNGQNFTIFCKSSTPVQIKQQHISEIDVGDFTKKQRQVTSPDDKLLNEYETALDLYNVDRYAIGYYACFDNAVNESIILNNIQKEPNNTEHVSYIYIYVDGETQHSHIMNHIVLLDVIPTAQIFIFYCVNYRYE